MHATTQESGWRGTLASSRVISAAEVALGAAVVIGHNVFRVVPNEVLILGVLGLVSSRIRHGGFAALGFRRPPSWTRVVGIALAAAALRIVAGEWLVVPLAQTWWPAPDEAIEADELAGNAWLALQWLALVWSFAAFGEEVAYRGYLLGRFAHAGGGGVLIWWIGVVVVAVLFGYGHYYKGPAGIIDSSVAGLILGAAYLLSGRNLWTAVLAHGFIDSFAVTIGYLGFAS